MRAVAELWFAQLRDKSPTTMESYRRILDRHIVGPTQDSEARKAPPVLLADLRLRELSPWPNRVGDGRYSWDGGSINCPQRTRSTQRPPRPGCLVRVDAHPSTAPR